jgi:nucleotide-binding universal stress UspA family protein
VADLHMPSDGGVILFQDDFQDGQPDGWQITGPWNVEQYSDVYVFGSTGRGAAWIPAGHDWSNYLLHAGIRLETGSLFLSMDLTQGGRYLLRLSPEATTLLKEQPAGNLSILAQTGPLAAGTGYSVVLAAQDGQLQFYVDGALWIDIFDSAPISRGTIAVSSLEGARVAVDNIVVTQLIGMLPAGEAAAPPSVEGAPTVEEIQAELAELPLAEISSEEVEIEEGEGETVDEIVEGGLPDLVVTGASFDPDPVTSGQPFTASYAFQNQGNAPSGAFTVRLHFHAATGLADCNADYPPLEAGQSAWGGCVRTTNAPAGTSPTEFTLDVEGEIAESDEGNNLATPTLTVVASAMDGGGEAEAEPQADLAAPINCSAEASRNSISINWMVPGALEGHLGFRVYLGGGSLEWEQADAGFRNAFIENLEPATQYHFDVRAYNAVSESVADACAVDVTTLE